ncbi:MAG: glycosyltransferase [Phycisphaerales bacterium]|nr:glycosyltransferase [Phycisphaerales bacterium]
MPSVVIPAHNEANVIRRCLDALPISGCQGDLEIIVVCNGCTDETAQVADAIEGVRVLQTETASKSHALNLGDEAASSYPRLYLDADVELESGAIPALFAALSEKVLAVSPAPRFQIKRSSLLVRMFYRAWMKMPFYNSSMIGGSGAYALSEKGRSRFGGFPDIISDDGYVRLQFSQDERRLVTEAASLVHCPRNLKSLLSMMTRVDAGGIELRELEGGLLARNEEVRPSERIRTIAKHPWLLPSFVVYATVRFITRRRAARVIGPEGCSKWGRDDSSRIENRAS